MNLAGTIIIVNSCYGRNCDLPGWDWLWVTLISLGVALIFGAVAVWLDD